jgi:hypothetical protein
MFFGAATALVTPAPGQLIMMMTPALRKFALTAHVTSSVGWLGSVAAFLALAIAGLNSRDAQTMRAVYVSMELIGWGRTPYGQRKERDERPFSSIATAAAPNRDWITGRSWPYALAIIVLLLVVVVLHLTGIVGGH